LVEIRRAELKDLEGITKIYNNVILNSIATFDTEEKTVDQQTTWFKEHSSKNPLIVAVEQDEIIGWAALSKYSTRCAYLDTVELSLYVKEGDQGKDIGKKLMEEIVDEGRKGEVHAIISRITEGNEISVHLHKSVGFEHIGIYKEVGSKFGKRLDVYLMEKVYK